MMRLFSYVTLRVFSGIRSTIALPIILSMLLAGCESTGNVVANYAPSANKNTGLVLFSVTHDKGQALRTAHNTKLFIRFKGVGKEAATDIPRAFSNMETMSPLMTTPFEDVWGRVYVREFAAGSYTLSGWWLEYHTGVSSNSISPKKPPTPIKFDVQPGSVTYIGNVHGSLLWGKNLFGIPLVAGAIPEIRNEAERDMKLILKDYPQLEGKVVVSPLSPGPWLAE